MYIHSDIFWIGWLILGHCPVIAPYLKLKVPELLQALIYSQPKSSIPKSYMWRPNTYCKNLFKMRPHWCVKMLSYFKHSNIVYSKWLKAVDFLWCVFVHVRMWVCVCHILPDTPVRYLSQWNLHITLESWGKGRLCRHVWSWYISLSI